MGAPIIRYEAGQTPQAWTAASDSGDAKKFSVGFSPISSAAGFEPSIAPYGLLTGGAITTNATNNTVSVAALTASMAGATGASAAGVVSVAAGSATVTRPATNVAKVCSVTIDSTGAIAVVAGTDGASTTFSETRGAAGGPPFIPVGSVELGQVRLTTSAAAVVAAGEIFQVVGTHCETSGYPVYALDYGLGTVTFADVLPKIHTGSLPKKVYAKGYTPLFSAIPNTSDWVPAESTYSINSTDTYDGPVGSASSSLGQASFTAQLKDGITDAFVASKGKNLWFEFRPDRDKTIPKQLTQGILGIARSNPASGAPSASCTVTPSAATLDVAS
ncbi:MAG: hypothetical protein RJA36_1303 [Pseudomonadota bacterium]|jgi:hypothetical protein